MKRPRLLAALPLALACLSAAAQDVHRCEAADGRIGYASGTCPAGTVAVRTLPGVEAPSPTEQTAAQQRAQQDVRRAAAIDRARLAEEERAAREQAQQLARARKQEAQCRRLQVSVRHAQEDLAAARAQKRAELQRRLARAEELAREECGR